MGGVLPKFGGGSARNPLLPYAYLWGNGDMYAVIGVSSLPRRKS